MQIFQLILGAVVVAGCSGSAIDVGPGSGGTSSGGDLGSSPAGAGGTSGTAVPPSLACVDTTPLPAWPDPTGCVASSDLPLSGTWNGYVENASPPWDMLTLVINGASVTGGLCGTLTIGTGTPPPPATDPDADYPPSVDHSHGGMPGFIPGVPLTMLKGTTDGTRVRFSVSSSEPYRSWCALQSSYSNAATGTPSLGCTCLPNWAGMGSTSAIGQCTLLDPTHAHNLTVSCAHMVLCATPLGPCACNASGCDGATNSGEIADFDLRFTGDSAEGSNTDSSGVRTYFTRVP